jgi:large subunit ribosomal protein L32
MAVQQNKKSPSKRGMRRAHDFLDLPTIATDDETGEVYRRHHMTTRQKNSKKRKR